MTRIAHLTDLHLLEDDHGARSSGERLRLSFLSFGRRLDPQRRRRRLARWIDLALRAEVDHVLITGDLTEDGTDAQLEALAEVLLDSPLDPDRVTLVPGNHDAYTDAGAFRRALEGPLGPFRRTSAPGAATVLDEVVVVPVSTAMPQPVTRSAGEADAADLEKLRVLATAPSLRHRAVVVGMHHPPAPNPLPPAQWIDGLQNHRAVRAVLGDHARMHVLHGHTHREADRAVGLDRRPRAFCANAVVDSDAPLRLYEARGGRLEPIDTSWGLLPTAARIDATPPAACPA